MDDPGDEWLAEPCAEIREPFGMGFDVVGGAGAGEADACRRADHQHVDRLFLDPGVKLREVAVVGEVECCPGLLEHEQVGQRRRPVVELARDLPAEGTAWPFGLDEQDAERPGDGESEPVGAAGEVNCSVDLEGGLRRAGVPVGHHGRTGRNHGIVTVAEQGLS